MEDGANPAENRWGVGGAASTNSLSDFIMCLFLDMVLSREVLAMRDERRVRLTTLLARDRDESVTA